MNNFSDFSMSKLSVLLPIGLAANFLTTGIVSAEEREPSSNDSAWRVNAGIGGYVLPEYEGSDEYQIIGFPFVDLTYKDRVFFNFFDGLGAYLYKTDAFSLKSSLGYEFGREENDAPILAGVGNIEDSAALKLEAEYQLGMFNSFVSMQQLQSGTEGMLGEVGIEAFVPLGEDPRTSPSLLLSLSAEYADDDHMIGYYGVSDLQATNSGLTEYQPDAGFNAANAQVSFIYPLAGRWSATTSLQYSQIVGDAAESPLIVEEGQVSGGVFFTYSF